MIKKIIHFLFIGCCFVALTSIQNTWGMNDKLSLPVRKSNIEPGYYNLKDNKIGSVKVKFKPWFGQSPQEDARIFVDKPWLDSNNVYHHYYYLADNNRNVLSEDGYPTGRIDGVLTEDNSNNEIHLIVVSNTNTSNAASSNPASDIATNNNIFPIFAPLFANMNADCKSRGSINK